ncbi:MAG: hypothetical protein FGM15_13035 [Chthoniobacterales bacterium]|nr:hypothetical protein [Chthoniobacterales bacterium]
MKRILQLIVPVVCLLGAMAPLRAALIINMVESSSNVVATISGSINSWTGAGTPADGSGAMGSGIRPGGTTSLVGFGNFVGFVSTNWYYYTASTFPTNFGPLDNFWTPSSASASTTMMFRANVNTNNMYISKNYVLGTPVTGTLTWSNKSFATLQVTPGTYVWSWTGDSMTMNIGSPAPAIPEPGTWAAAALLVGGAGYVRWRKRAKIS